MVFSKEVNTGARTWKWGDKDIPEVVSWGLNLLRMVHGIVMYRI